MMLLITQNPNQFWKKIMNELFNRINSLKKVGLLSKTYIVKNDLFNANEMVGTNILNDNSLSRYFAAELQVIQKEFENNEMVEQPIIQMLGLISFLKEAVIDRAEKKVINEIENKLISMCAEEARNEIISEANAQCAFYKRLGIF